MNRRDFLKLLQLSPLLLANCSSRPPSVSTKSHDGPNILILVFDTFSAAHLTLSDYPRQTTPQIEKAAQSALVYHRHYAGGNFTTPGTASLLTGSYPWTHRAYRLSGQVHPNRIQDNIFANFQAQYNTFAYTHNDYAQVLLNQFFNEIDDLIPRRELSLRSFHHADQLPPNHALAADLAENLIFGYYEQVPTSSFLSRFIRNYQHAQHEQLLARYQDQFAYDIPNSGIEYFTIDSILQWLLTHLTTQSQPFLGYVHLLPPHYPYNPATKFSTLFEDGWQPDFTPQHVFTARYQPDELNIQRRYYD